MINLYNIQLTYIYLTTHIILNLIYKHYRLLNEAQGSLLDDVHLVNTLQTSKETSKDVGEQLQTAEITEVKIDGAREVSNCYIICKNFSLAFL